jgi:DNA-binding beta-propeller fold protein YncE
MRGKKHHSPMGVHDPCMRRVVAVMCAVGLSTFGLAAGSYATSTSGGPGQRATSMAMPMGDLPAADPPVAVGPRPAVFKLGDTNGAWMDTGTSISGTRSLAVASAPTAVADGAPGSATARVIGDGFLTGKKLQRAMNTDLPALNPKLDLRGKTLGQLGVNIDRMLGLDRTRATARQILKPGDPRIAKIDLLTKRFAAEMATQPANRPQAMNASPSGSELMKTLQGIRASDPMLPVTITFHVGEPLTDQAHTATSLIWPDGAKGMPFTQGGAFLGDKSVQLSSPGLYAFACKVHPYMLGAVEVMDPLMPGVYFGKKLHIASRGLISSSMDDVLYQLIKEFFIITNTDNWQRFSATEDRTWNPSFAPVPVLAFDSSGNPQLIPDLDSFMKDKYHLPMSLPKADQKPSVPGVGEVWFDTELEKYAGKEKPGAATKLNAETWQIERKIAAPEINMNNPHNMWTDKDEKYLYVTEWWSHWLNVFDKSTGKLIRRFDVGPSPTHVMTRTDTDELTVALGGGEGMRIIAPGATKLDYRIPTGTLDEPIAYPHAMWQTGNAKYLVTPNVNLYNASVVDLQKHTFRHEATGEFPIATGMDPAGARVYTADFLGQDITCITLEPNGKACHGDDGTMVHSKQMDLWKDYSTVTGPSGAGGFGGLPIQIAVAPDNSAGIVANVFGANWAVFDPKTDKIVKYLPGYAGAHGVNFGAKKGGGYYAYATSKFANVIDVFDLDPNGTGNPADATRVGRIIADAGPETKVDDQVTDLAGMGGMGVLPVPIAYEGWVEHAPKSPINNELTCRQRHPLTFAKACK